MYKILIKQQRMSVCRMVGYQGHHLWHQLKVVTTFLFQKKFEKFIRCLLFNTYLVMNIIRYFIYITLFMTKIVFKLLNCISQFVSKHVRKVLMVDLVKHNWQSQIVKRKWTDTLAKKVNFSSEINYFENVVNMSELPQILC